MTTVVISQPMLFPWVGMFEQIRLADVYVHYDDVQFSKGSFTNRVQIKTADGFRWLTIPLANRQLSSRIMDLTIDDRQDWRSQHLTLLEREYAEAPFRTEMLQLVRQIYDLRAPSLVHLLIAGMHAVIDYFQLCPATHFVRSSEMAIPGRSSERVLDFVRHFQGTRYVTGHGAKRYLDHERFEQFGVAVAYLDYQKIPYPQLHGTFNPFVSVLDLIANQGRAGRAVIQSPTVPWRTLLDESGT